MKLEEERLKYNKRISQAYDTKENGLWKIMHSHLNKNA